MQEIAVAWARRRRMRVAATGHVIVCKRTGAVMFVDFVLEGIRNRQCFLASVYYSQSRGGPLLQYAREYMQKVQSICRRHMNFDPAVLALCVYGKSGQNARVYATDVGNSG